MIIDSRIGSELYCYWPECGPNWFKKLRLMFHFWFEDNKWLRNKKWSFIIKSSRVKYTRILDPQIAFDVNDRSGIFPGPFFARVRLNFSEKVKIASYSIFWWAEASQAWAGISPITSGWSRPSPRPRRIMKQQSLLIIMTPPFSVC